MMRLTFDIIQYKMTINMVYLVPNVVCSSVMIPDTNKIVLSTWLMTTAFPSKHKGTLRMKGMPIVPPTIVR